MKGINRCVIAGHLGADPTVTNFANGGKVVHISVASKEIWIDKQTQIKKESVEWHRLSIYDALGDYALKFLKKGDAVYTESKSKTRKYDDNGETKYSHEFRVYDLQPLANNSDKSESSDATNKDMGSSGQQVSSAPLNTTKDNVGGVGDIKNSTSIHDDAMDVFGDYDLDNNN